MPPAAPFRPYRLTPLLVAALAVPVASLVLASFASVGFMDVLGVSNADAIAARTAGSAPTAGYELASAAGSLVFEGTMLVLTILVARRAESPWPVASLALGPWRKAPDFLPYLLLMIGWQIVETLLIEPRFPDLASIDGLPKSQSALFLSMLTVVLAAPIAEELFFRGFLYSHLRRHWSFGPTIAATAVYFSCLHYGGSLVFPLITLPFALIAGLARERYGSVRPAVYLHLLWNLIAWGATYFALPLPG